MKRFNIALVAMMMSVFALQSQITVNVTGNTNTSPALFASYPSLKEALDSLNKVTAMTGPVTFTCSGTETVAATGLILGSSTLNPVLNSTNTITINGPATINAGTGTATSSSATPDGMFVILGADHVTVNGLTFTDGNAANPATMEFGIALFKRNAGDGANNNTIQNCIFNMQRINNASSTSPMVEGSVAILVINSTPTTATTSIIPTNGGTLSTNGTNSGNRIYGNQITGGNYGIVFSGYAATVGVGPSPNASTFLGDINNDIGGSSAITANTVLNFGGAAAATNPSAGIRTNNQWGINISYNTVNNNNGSGVNHVSTLRGIFAQSGTSANATISNNNVTIQSGALTSACNAIDNGIGSTAASNTINITNNTVNLAYSTATSGVSIGINNSATAATLNINNNTINGILSTFLSGTGTHILIETGSAVSVNVNNNILQNFQRNGASGSWRGIKTTSPTNLIISGNTVDNLSWTNLTSTGGIDGIYSLSSAVNVTMSNNIVKNLSTPTTGTINGLREFGSSGTKIIQNNQVSNISCTPGGTGGGTYSGIFLSTGIITASNNKIYDITSIGANGTVIGLNISGGTGPHNVFNNYIGNLSTPASTGINAIRGIELGNSAVNNIYFNTVYLNATSTSVTTFGSSCLFFNSSQTSVDLRNNILVNLSTPAQEGLNIATNGVAATLRRASGTSGTVPTNYATTSDRNLYWVNPTLGTNNHLTYVEGTTTITNPKNTVADLKAFMANRDQNSIQENPPFLSTTGTSPQFLHINPAIPTQLEAAASPIGTILTDYDGDTRSVTTPDIGADEGTFILADFSSPNISYTPLTFTCDGSINRTLTATISDFSGVPTSGLGLPVLYWRINAGAYTAVTGTHVSGNTYSFSFGAGAVNPNVISYYIVAQDNVGNVGSFPSLGASGFSSNPPAVSTPPSNPSSYNISLTLSSGTYTVGTGGNYPTLTSAINTYNNSCLNGPVVFSLIDASYTTTADTIRNNPFSSSTNTLTIKPTVPCTISGNTAGATLLLSGADYIIIDGSTGNTVNSICPLSTATKDLTVTNSNTGTLSAVIWLTHTGTDGSNNNTIKNCNIVGNSPTTTLIGLGSGSTIGSPAISANNNNNSYINNNLSKLQLGIYSAGINTSLKNNGTNISQNLMNTPSPNNISRGGIAAFSENNIIVSGNNISELLLTNTIDVFAINLGNLTLSTSTTSGVDCNNAIITKNIIGSIRQTNTYTAAGIYLAPGSTGVSEISNNMISGVSANGTSGDFSVGIFINPSDGSITNVYYNTVAMQGTQSGGSDRSYCLAIAGGTTPTVNIKNNIFTNTLNNGTGLNYAIGLGYTTFTNITSNNNDFFTTTGSLYSIGATSSISLPVNQITLANWQSSTTKDANSLNIAPTYVSSTDLHLQSSNTALNGVGSVVSITDDIDCNPRNATTPDIGADEFDPPACVAAVGGTASGNATNCKNYSGSITASGYSTGLNSTYTWVKSTSPTGPWSAIPGANNPASYTISPAVTVTTYFKLAVACGTNASFDSSSVVTITINPAPTASVSPGSLSICSPANQVFTATTDIGTAYQWKKDGANISGETNSTYTASLSGAYQVVITNGANGCKDSSAISILTVNDPPSSVTASASPLTLCSGETLNLTSSAAAPLPHTMNPNSGISFIDISTSGTSVGITADDSEHNLTIPPFTFNGVSYSTARVGNNGVLVFGTTTGDIIYNNSALPQDIAASTTSTTGLITGSGNSLAAICANWDDMTPSTSVSPSTIYTQTVGNKYIVQWHNEDNFNATGTGVITFQIQLDLVSNQIHLVYQDINYGVSGFDGGQSATIGLNYSGTSALQYSFNTISLVDGQSITFTPNTYTYSWSGPGGYNSAVQNPTIAAIPSNGSGIYTVTVTNSNSLCFSTANTESVTVTPGSVGGSVNSNQSICSGLTPVDVNLTGQTGSVVKWQKSSDAAFTSPVDISNTTATLTSAEMGPLTSNTWFRAVVQNGSCLAANSASVMITVNMAPSTPTGAASQEFCASAVPTVASLSASSGLATITWYDMASGGAVVPSSTALVDGMIYYAEASEGSCISASRLAVTAILTGNTVTASGNNGPKTLRAVIGCALEGSTVQVDGTVTMITLTEALDIAKNLTIQDIAGSPVMINIDFTNISTYGIDILLNKTVTLEKLQLKGINNTMNLPVLQVDGYVNIIDVTTSNN